MFYIRMVTHKRPMDLIQLKSLSRHELNKTRTIKVNWIESSTSISWKLVLYVPMRPIYFKNVINQKLLIS